MANVVIIGGGAAGCFCAVQIARRHPDWSVSVLEAGKRLMAKLAVTGGGHCNITNSFEDVDSLESVYPRGFRVMKRALSRFGWQDCLDWFGALGIEFTVQEDHCVFPVSQDAMQIVRALEKEMRLRGVWVHCGCKVVSISSDRTLKVSGIAAPSGQELAETTMRPDIVVLTSGGGTAGILSGTDIQLQPPVPSLFTLKLSDEGIRSLMGIVVDNAGLGLAGTRFRSHGTLLLTDWGVSGPVTLKLSSYAARFLAENGYKGSLLVNWLDKDEAATRALLGDLSRAGGKMIINTHPPQLSDRLWRHLVLRAKIREDCRWSEVGSKGLARLISILTADTYEITGRARFKEEFVTCGGVSLGEVNPNTFEARKVPGLYFAGEVLDIDAVTGGFNLQAAWSTAWAVASSL